MVFSQLQSAKRGAPCQSDLRTWRTSFHADAQGVDADFRSKKVSPPIVIFWNHGVSGRTGAKSWKEMTCGQNLENVRLSGKEWKPSRVSSDVDARFSALSYGSQLLTVSF